MTIQFLGHASLLLTIDQIYILVDPFISGNPKASQIDLEAIKADYILLTHAHQVLDHPSAGLLALKHGPPWQDHRDRSSERL